MQQVTELILNKFDGFRMPEHADDQYATIGKQKLADRIDEFVLQGQPIRFSMLGYPYKSPNDRDKTIGKLPDLAEEVSLKNFDSFDRAIKGVYAPGIKLSIISDGYAFNKVWGPVDDSIVAEYEEMTRDMSKNFNISWYGMQDFYDRSLSLDSMRDKVIAQFGVTQEELQRRILMDPDVNYLYRGMVKFLNLDLLNKGFSSPTQLQKAAKIMAKDMMVMNEAYSELIRHNFGDHIRLSMHNSVNNGNKYSFQLIPSPKAWTSPWHCALLIHKDGVLETIHRKDAVAAGYELVYKDNRPYYFTEN